MQRSLLVLGILFLTIGSTAPAQQPTIKDVNDAIRYLKSSNPQDRAAALAAMSYLEEGKSASKEVVGLIFDNSPLVSGWAKTALSKVNPELAGPVLELVNSKDEDARMQAMEKLVGMGPDLGAAALPALAKFLNQADEKDRVSVVNAMVKLGVKDPGMAAYLANVGLKDNDPAVRKAALAGLPKLANTQGAVNMLNNLLTNSDPAERALAVTGLSAIAATNPEAMKALQAAAKDPSPSVSGAAKVAVEKAKKEQKSK